MTNPFATTLLTPIYIVGHTAPATTYFNTSTVTPPAIPPAKLANPKNSTTRAFQATPLPEYEKLSAESRVFSIELMMSMPREEKMRGSQSMKVMWIVLPFLEECDHTAASRRIKKARENCHNYQQADSLSNIWKVRASEGRWKQYVQGTRPSLLLPF